MVRQVDGRTVHTTPAFIQQVIGSVSAGPQVAEALKTSKIWGACVLAQKVLATTQGKWCIDPGLSLLREAIVKKSGHPATRRVMNFIVNEPTTNLEDYTLDPVMWRTPEEFHAGMKQAMYFREVVGDKGWKRPLDWDFLWRGNGTKVYTSRVVKPYSASEGCGSKIYQQPYQMVPIPHTTSTSPSEIGPLGMFKQLDLLNDMRDYCLSLEEVVGSFVEKDIEAQSELRLAESIIESLSREVDRLKVGGEHTLLLRKIEEQLVNICSEIHPHTRDVRAEEDPPPAEVENSVSVAEDFLVSSEGVKEDVPDKDSGVPAPSCVLSRPLHELLNTHDLRKHFMSQKYMPIGTVVLVLPELAISWELKHDCLEFWFNGSKEQKCFRVAVVRGEFVMAHAFIRVVEGSKFPLKKFMGLYITNKDIVR
jgi:hypothetical protein